MNAIQIHDDLVMWDDYFGAYMDITALPVTEAPDRIEIIHPEDPARNVMAIKDHIVMENARVRSWIYELNLHDDHEYFLTLYNA